MVVPTDSLHADYFCEFNENLTKSAKVVGITNSDRQTYIKSPMADNPATKANLVYTSTSLIFLVNLNENLTKSVEVTLC